MGKFLSLLVFVFTNLYLCAEEITPVSNLIDVGPGRWAGEALKSLGARYGCPIPDRQLSRYEFAQGLNNCLGKINQLLSQGLAEKVSMQDLDSLEQLREMFAKELALLGNRVEKLEQEVTNLQRGQFSTTTKLSGSVIFLPAFTTGGLSSNLTWGGRVRLNLSTSFSGADFLRTRLQFGNVAAFNSRNTGTNMTRLAVDENTAGNFSLDDLWYRFPIGESVMVFLGAKSLDFDDVFDPISTLNSGEFGGLSRFHRRDALTLRLPEGTGVGLQLKLDPKLNLNLGYMTGDLAPNPVGQGGLTNGDYTGALQLLFKPVPKFKLSAIYARSFDNGDISLTGATGSSFGNNPLGGDTNTDRYGMYFSWDGTANFALGGGISFVNAFRGGETAELLTWVVNLTFPDLGGKGNRGGIAFGQPPRVTATSLPVNPDARGTAYNLEIFYRYRVNAGVTIQPGVFFVFNPEHNTQNDTIVVGALRTTFSF